MELREDSRSEPDLVRQYSAVIRARYRSRRILPSYGIGSVRTESDNKLLLLEEEFIDEFI